LHLFNWFIVVFDPSDRDFHNHSSAGVIATVGPTQKMVETVSRGIEHKPLLWLCHLADVFSETVESPSAGQEFLLEALPKAFGAGLIITDTSSNSALMMFSVTSVDRMQAILDGELSQVMLGMLRAPLFIWGVHECSILTHFQ
jgi:hypothetical protein